ncbi:uncharacterized protein YciI [Paraburkholderia sp. GAS448]|uniref:hypothetical protein n=1 Tax=Paraburkholderia sp. GAS448 TaxID=3035136 RepID=UPI003D2561FA
MAHFLVEIQFVAAAEQQDLLEQRAFLERIANDRSLLLAAVLPQSPGKGLAIIRAPSVEAAKAIYNDAPLFKKGIIGWTMTEITPTYGIAANLA